MKSNNVNRHITPNGLQEVIKNLPTKKWPGPDGVNMKLYHIFKVELTLVLLKVFHEAENKEHFQILLLKASFTLLPNQTNTLRKKQYYLLSNRDI